MDNNIVTMPIKDIHPYEGNPRINDDAVEAVAASIREFGFRNRKNIVYSVLKTLTELTDLTE